MGKKTQKNMFYQFLIRRFIYRLSLKKYPYLDWD